MTVNNLDWGQEPLRGTLSTIPHFGGCFPDFQAIPLSGQPPVRASPPSIAQGCAFDFPREIYDKDFEFSPANQRNYPPEKQEERRWGSRRRT